MIANFELFISSFFPIIKFTFNTSNATSYWTRPSTDFDMNKLQLWYNTWFRYNRLNTTDTYIEFLQSIKGGRPQAFDNVFCGPGPLIFLNSGRNGLNNDILKD